jgi:hypothetical protein
MQKYLLTLAVLAGVSLVAQADFGMAPPMPPGYGPPAAANGGGIGYGWNPIVKKLLWWKKDKGDCESCASGSCGKHGKGSAMGFPGAGVPGIPQPGQPGMGMPGTLVFPNHPFVRSPRDYFMTGPGGY